MGRERGRGWLQLSLIRISLEGLGPADDGEKAVGAIREQESMDEDMEGGGRRTVPSAFCRMLVIIWSSLSYFGGLAFDSRLTNSPSSAEDSRGPSATSAVETPRSSPTVSCSAATCRQIGTLSIQRGRAAAGRGARKWGEVSRQP